MNVTLKLVCLIFILNLNFSCAEKKSIDGHTNKLDLESNELKDTLKFTSGIRAIFQDSKGNFWFGSLQEGVAVYNGKSFKYFDNYYGLSDNQIHSIQEDKNGVLWFGTQSGVSSYDGTRISNRTNPSKGNSQGVLPIQGNDKKQSGWMKTENDLWFEADNKSGVYRYDGHELHYLDLPPQKVINLSDNLFAVTDIASGKNNMIWFATYAGIFGYNGNDFTIVNDDTLGYDRKVEALHIRSIYEDSKGRLWIGNNGIGVLLKEGDSIINFSNKHGLIHPNSKLNEARNHQKAHWSMFLQLLKTKVETFGLETEMLEFGNLMVKSLKIIPRKMDWKMISFFLFMKIEIRNYGLEWQMEKYTSSTEALLRNNFKQYTRSNI
ncbi:ligand-binding sensor domain-containing protein [Belliella filtrata]